MSGGTGEKERGPGMAVGQDKSVDDSIKALREGLTAQPSCDREKLKQFLDFVWDLPGQRIIGVQLFGGDWKWFVVNSVDDVLDILVKYPLARVVSYGVNPRSKDVAGRKGSDEDIDQADNLFADLDFKEEAQCTPNIRVDEPNGRLNACIKDEGKTFEVDRPSVDTLLKKLKELGLPEPSAIIDSGTGYHLIWKLERPLPRGDWKKVEGLVVDRLTELGADPQARDISRILRLPCSVNPKSNRQVRVLYINNRKYKPEDFGTLEPVAGSTGPEKKTEEEKKAVQVEPGSLKLTEEQIEELVEALSSCFSKAEGHRFEFVGHLSGALCRRGVPLEQAEEIVLRLYEKAGLKPEHAKDVKYTYKDCQAGKPVTGLNSLRALCEDLGEEIILPAWFTRANRPKAEKRGEEGKKEGAEGAKGGKEERATGKDGSAESRDGQRAITGPTVLRSNGKLAKKVLFATHDFVDGKPYITIYDVDVVERVNKRGKPVKEEVLIDHIFTVDDNGEIVELTGDKKEKLYDSYWVAHVAATPQAYRKKVIDPDVNVPTKVVPDVKISEVYRKVTEYLKKKVTLASEEDYAVTAVWIIASYFFPVFSEFPYLVPYKEGYGSGGTEFLKTMWKLLPRAEILNMPTPASIYNIVNNLRGSLLIDEFDERKMTEEQLKLLWNILASCYHKGASIPRVIAGDVERYRCYGPKVIIDQRLVFSHADIATRSVFVRLKQDPTRDPDSWDKDAQDLVDELFSVFLKYAQVVHKYYSDKEGFDIGYHGREGQTLRPLLVVAGIIEMEDETLNVVEKVRKGLEYSVEYHSIVKEVGDPKVRLTNAVKEYIVDSLKDAVEHVERGEGADIPRPWHAKRNADTIMFYIYATDLAKEVRKRLMSIYQRDVSLLPKPDGSEVLNVREWERLPPDLEDFLNERTFAAFLRHQFGRRVDKHRHKVVLTVTVEDVKQFMKELEGTEGGGATEGQQETGTAPAGQGNISNVAQATQNAVPNAGGDGQVLTEEELLKLKVLDAILMNEIGGQHGIMSWRKFREVFGNSKDVMGIIEELLNKGYIATDRERLWITPEGYFYLDELKKRAPPGTPHDRPAT